MEGNQGTGVEHCQIYVALLRVKVLSFLCDLDIYLFGSSLPLPLLYFIPSIHSWGTRT